MPNEPTLEIGTPQSAAAPKGRCKLTFVWHNVLNVDHSASTTISYTTFIDEGKFSIPIQQMRSEGGAYFTDADGRFAFLPWPPMGIRIESA